MNTNLILNQLKLVDEKLGDRHKLLRESRTQQKHIEVYLGMFSRATTAKETPEGNLVTSLNNLNAANELLQKYIQTPDAEIKTKILELTSRIVGTDQGLKPLETQTKKITMRGDSKNRDSNVTTSKETPTESQSQIQKKTPPQKLNPIVWGNWHGKHTAGTIEYNLRMSFTPHGDYMMAGTYKEIKTGIKSQLEETGAYATIDGSMHMKPQSGNAKYQTWFEQEDETLWVYLPTLDQWVELHLDIDV